MVILLCGVGFALIQLRCIVTPIRSMQVEKLHDHDPVRYICTTCFERSEFAELHLDTMEAQVKKIMDHSSSGSRRPDLRNMHPEERELLEERRRMLPRMFAFRLMPLQQGHVSFASWTG